MVNTYIKIRSVSTALNWQVVHCLGRRRAVQLSHAYQQLLLDDESQKLVTVNTHKGLFKNNRLSFGMTKVPPFFSGWWNRWWSTYSEIWILSLCTCTTLLLRERPQLNTWQTLTKYFPDYRRQGCVWSRVYKCKFLLPEVKYLGLKFPDAKLEVVSKVSVPKNVSEFCCCCFLEQETLLTLLHFIQMFNGDLVSNGETACLAVASMDTWQ